MQRLGVRKGPCQNRLTVRLFVRNLSGLGDRRSNSEPESTDRPAAQGNTISPLLLSADSVPKCSRFRREESPGSAGCDGG